MSKNPLYRYTLKCNSIGYDELLGDGFNLGTVALSVADGYAMLYDSGQDFSKFSLPSGVSGFAGMSNLGAFVSTLTTRRLV